MTHLYRLISCSILLHCCICGGSAYGGERWDIQRLQLESDVVCVASLDAVSEVENDDFRPDDLKRLEALLVPEAVLKGKLDNGHFTFVYYAYRSEPSTVAMRPEFANFDAPTTLDEQDNAPLPRTTYLLFLKKRRDGKYGAISGSLDSGFSVCKVSTNAATPRR